MILFLVSYVLQEFFSPLFNQLPILNSIVNQRSINSEQRFKNNVWSMVVYLLVNLAL